MLDRGRVDADFDALSKQIFNETVERLVGAVAHIIVIAREEGHAEVTGLHGSRL